MDRVADLAGAAEPAALPLAEPAIFHPATVTAEEPATRVAAGVAGVVVEEPAAAAHPLAAMAAAVFAAMLAAALAEQTVAAAESRALAEEQAADPAMLAEVVVADPVLGVATPGDRWGEVRLAGGQVAGQDFPGDRVMEAVGGRQAGPRQRADQGNRKHHPSQMTEAHRHSLCRRTLGIPPGVSVIVRAVAKPHAILRASVAIIYPASKGREPSGAGSLPSRPSRIASCPCYKRLRSAGSPLRWSQSEPTPPLLSTTSVWGTPWLASSQAVSDAPWLRGRVSLT